MKKKKLVVWSMFISLIILYAFYIYDTNKTDSNVFTFLDTIEVFDSYEKVNSSPLTFKVSKENTQIGYLVFGEEVGYQSTIIMATIIDLDGNIIKTITYDQDESPAFYNRLIDQEFFEQYTDMAINDGFSIDSNIDAISQATISSNAAAKAIHKGSTFVGLNYLDIKTPKLYGKIRFGVSEMAVIVLFILTFIAHKTKNTRLRTVTLTYSFIVIGFKFSMFISYSFFLSLLVGKIPSIAENFRRYILFFGAILMIFSTGKNLYCTYMCPFGAIQEIEYRFAKLDVFKVSPNVRKFTSYIPVMLAYFALVVALGTQQIGAIGYEPFSLVFGGVGLDIQWIMLPVILFLSFLVMRFYCNVGCPVGFVLNLLVKIRRSVVKKWIKN